MKKKPKKCVRLACLECAREDFDGITEKQLGELQKTWDEIHEVQTWEESITIWTAAEQRDRLLSKSNFGWETHIGICPECQCDAEERCEPKQQTSLFT